MKEYEVIHEIFNQCPGNKTRDQFIEEIEIEEAPEEWIRKKFKNEKELQIEKIYNFRNLTDSKELFFYGSLV